MIDPELISFAMAGSKRIDQQALSPGPQLGLAWINDLMWAELSFLNTINPFNEENLTDHIMNNPEKWRYLFDMKQIGFSDLPNRNEINVR